VYIGRTVVHSRPGLQFAAIPPQPATAAQRLCWPRMASRSVFGFAAPPGPLPPAPLAPRSARPGPSRVTTRRRSASYSHVHSCSSKRPGVSGLCCKETSSQLAPACNQRSCAALMQCAERLRRPNRACTQVPSPNAQPGPAPPSPPPAPTCLGTTTYLSSEVTNCRVAAVSRTTMPCSPR
jgi:hypothetical protein